MSRRRLRSAWTVLYLAVVATLVVLIVPAWQRYTDGPAHADAAFRPPARSQQAVERPRPVTPVRRVVAPAPKPPPAPAPKPVRVVLVAARGDCWIRVRAGSPTGRVLWEGLLAGGSSRTFTGPRLVVFAGAPANLDAKLGRTSRGLGSQSLWVASAKGLEPLSL